MTSAGKSWTATIGGIPLTVRVTEDEHGQPVDVQASLGPLGNSLSMALGCVLMSVSISLRNGVPLALVMRGLVGQRCEPCGETGDELVPECLSLQDYVGASTLARYGSRGEVGQ
jgi:hypothetical protein